MEEGLDGVVLLLEVGFALCVQVILNRVITGEAKLLLLLLQNVNVKKFTGFKAECKDQRNSSFQPTSNLKFYLSCYFGREKTPASRRLPRVGSHGLYWGGERSAGMEGLVEPTPSSPFPVCSSLLGGQIEGNLGHRTGKRARWRG